MPRGDNPIIKIRRPRPIKISKSRIRRRRLIRKFQDVHGQIRLSWRRFTRFLAGVGGSRTPPEVPDSERYRSPSPGGSGGTATAPRPSSVSTGTSSGSRRRRPIVISSGALKAVCAYCGDDVPEEGESVPLQTRRFVCTQCGCVQHEECRERNGGCVALGPPH